MLGRFDCYACIKILKTFSLTLAQKGNQIRIQGLCSEGKFGNMSFMMCMKDPGKKGDFLYV